STTSPLRKFPWPAPTKLTAGGPPAGPLRSTSASFRPRNVSGAPFRPLTVPNSQSVGLGGSQAHGDRDVRTLRPPLNLLVSVHDHLGLFDGPQRRPVVPDHVEVHRLGVAAGFFQDDRLLRGRIRVPPLLHQAVAQRVRR